MIENVINEDNINNKNIKIKIQRLNDSVKIPEYATEGSAGVDLRSTVKCTIKAGERMLIPTGIKISIPKNYEAQIRPRSGLALKHGIILPNSPGTIDSDYRGEIGVIILNAGNEIFEVNIGDRVAQMVFVPVTRAIFEEVDSLDETKRGEGGFGSTGKN